MADIAADALASVRATANTTPARRKSSRRRSSARAEMPDNRGGYTAATTDLRDPQLLGPGVDRLMEERGWSERASVASVIARWPEIAGPDTASHVTPEFFDQDTGTLKLRADSTAWATQMRYLLPSLQSTLDAEIGPEIVRQIEVSGPAGPRRNYGPLRVPGRGYRDTYG